MTKKTASNFILLLAALIWGFAFVAQVVGMEHIGPITMVGVRSVIGIIALSPVMLISERRRSGGDEKKEQAKGKEQARSERKELIKASLIVGAILFLASVIQQYGIKITSSAGVSGFITGLYTIFVPVAYFLFFRRKTGIQIWIGAIVALCGLFLLCYDPESGISFGFGELLLLISSFLWTAHVIFIDRFVKKIPPLRLSLGQFAVCAALGIVSMFIFEADQLSIGALIDARWSLLYLGVMSSGVGYTLQIVGQKNADPAYAAIILSAESAFSAIGGALFGTDSIVPIGYVGCALMFGGIVCSQITPKKKKELSEQGGE